VSPVDPAVLNAKGSLFLTRPNLAHHLLTREEILWRVGDVMNYIASGIIHIRIAQTYPLADAAQAHRDLESRKTAGKLLLQVR
jgi:NADPH2:quinone reductase